MPLNYQICYLDSVYNIENKIVENSSGYDNMILTLKTQNQRKT